MIERILDFEVALERVACERVSEHPWGESFLCPSIPLIWDASWVLITDPELGAAQIAEIADQVIGGAGMEHRTVLVRDLVVAWAPVPEFEALGWDVERGATMRWRGVPDREPEVGVTEVGEDEIVGLRRELIAATLPPGGYDAGETIDQLLEWDRMLARAGGDRWFVARHEGEPAACCRLLAAGGVGQVEDVGTLPRARERGLGRAITLAAARASAADGNEITYLGARADDWPRLMYEKLGFELIAEEVTFRRRPEGIGPAEGIGSAG
ncbi:MAG: GNAT family N-acetyltransferase [Solirubrobacterales bacterium]